MSLAELMKKDGLRKLATMTVATPATNSPEHPSSVATVASVTVAEPQNAKTEPLRTPAQSEQSTLPEVAPAAAGGPQEEPEGATLADDMPDPAALLEARLERAAILEHEAGMTRAEAEREAARLHPAPDPGATWHGFTRRELLALTDPCERADLDASPEALEAFAFALRLVEIRERGERPDHYTRAAYCETCGPVWLFPGDADRVLGCPWCKNTANGRLIPRPPVVCSDCRRWRPDEINPPGGLGSCTAEAPESKRPGALWPRGEITCGDWRPKSEEQPA